jgi:hypothetical protein
MPFNKQSIVALLNVRADEHTYQPTHLGLLQAPKPVVQGPPIDFSPQACKSVNLLVCVPGRTQGRYPHSQIDCQMINCPSHQLHVHLLQQTTMKKSERYLEIKIVANDTFSCFGQVTKWDFSMNIVTTSLNLQTLDKTSFPYRNLQIRRWLRIPIEG